MFAAAPSDIATATGSGCSCWRSGPSTRTWTWPPSSRPSRSRGAPSGTGCAGGVTRSPTWTARTLLRRRPTRPRGPASSPSWRPTEPGMAPFRASATTSSSSSASPGAEPRSATSSMCTVCARRSVAEVVDPMTRPSGASSRPSSPGPSGRAMVLRCRSPSTAWPTPSTSSSMSTPTPGPSSACPCVTTRTGPRSPRPSPMGSPRPALPPSRSSWTTAPATTPTRSSTPSQTR